MNSSLISSASASAPLSLPPSASLPLVAHKEAREKLQVQLTECFKQLEELKKKQALHQKNYKFHSHNINKNISSILLAQKAHSEVEEIQDKTSQILDIYFACQKEQEDAVSKQAPAPILEDLSKKENAASKNVFAICRQFNTLLKARQEIIESIGHLLPPDISKASDYTIGTALKKAFEDNHTQHQILWQKAASAAEKVEEQEDLIDKHTSEIEKIDALMNKALKVNNRIEIHLESDEDQNFEGDEDIKMGALKQQSKKQLHSAPKKSKKRKHTFTELSGRNNFSSPPSLPNSRDNPIVIGSDDSSTESDSDSSIEIILPKSRKKQKTGDAKGKKQSAASEAQEKKTEADNKGAAADIGPCHPNEELFPLSSLHRLIIKDDLTEKELDETIQKHRHHLNEYINKLVDGWAPLHLLIRRGDPKLLKALLKYGPDLSLTTQDGWNALHLAAISKNLENCDKKELIEILEGLYAGMSQGSSGTNVVNMPNKHQTYPCHLACYYSNINILTFFLKKGAEVNKLDNTRFAPLHYALMSDSLLSTKKPIIQLLSTYPGIDINIRDINQRTPLMLLADLGYESLIKEFLSLEACRKEINLQDLHGWTASDFAINPFLGRVIKGRDMPKRLKKVHSLFKSMGGVLRGNKQEYIDALYPPQSKRKKNKPIQGEASNE